MANPVDVYLDSDIRWLQTFSGISNSSVYAIFCIKRVISFSMWQLKIESDLQINIVI